MADYIDGFVLPIPTDKLEAYKTIATEIANIWKEYGALSYSEYLLDDPSHPATLAFAELTDAHDNEAVVFGWVAFASRAARDQANEKVAADPRMTELIAPLTRKPQPIFDPERMLYGGFKSLIQI